MAQSHLSLRKLLSPTSPQSQKSRWLKVTCLSGSYYHLPLPRARRPDSSKAPVSQEATITYLSPEPEDQIAQRHLSLRKLLLPIPSPKKQKNRWLEVTCLSGSYYHQLAPPRGRRPDGSKAPVSGSYYHLPPPLKPRRPHCKPGPDLNSHLTPEGGMRHS
jgi:hypothetical protein